MILMNVRHCLEMGPHIIMSTGNYMQFPKPLQNKHLPKKTVFPMNTGNWMETVLFLMDKAHLQLQIQEYRLLLVQKPTTKRRMKFLWKKSHKPCVQHGDRTRNVNSMSTRTTLPPRSSTQCIWRGKTSPEEDIALSLHPQLSRLSRWQLQLIFMDHAKMDHTMMNQIIIYASISTNVLWLSVYSENGAGLLKELDFLFVISRRLLRILMTKHLRQPSCGTNNRWNCMTRFMILFLVENFNASCTLC